jgi:hypothetical protein
LDYATVKGPPKKGGEERQEAGGVMETLVKDFLRR